MKDKKRARKLPKYLWLTGFLGFGGFLGFMDLRHNLDVGAFLFFAFFGFFAWYWEYKLQQSGEDERLSQNRSKATMIAFRAAFSIIWIGVLVTNNLLTKIFPIMRNYEYRYALITILIALGFAISLILNSYLTYRYDTRE